MQAAFDDEEEGDVVVVTGEISEDQQYSENDHASEVNHIIEVGVENGSVKRVDGAGNLVVFVQHYLLLEQLFIVLFLICILHAF